MSKEAQRTIIEEAGESFDRNIATSVGEMDSDLLSLCRKCYCLGFINGGDHVLSQVQAVKYS